MSGYKKRGTDSRAQSGSSKRHKTSTIKCPTEEPHDCTNPVSRSAKYYAILGGPNPGVHNTIWDVARPWAEGNGPQRQKSFKGKGEAWEWYKMTKAQFLGSGGGGMALRGERAAEERREGPRLLKYERADDERRGGAPRLLNYERAAGERREEGPRLFEYEISRGGGMSQREERAADERREQGPRLLKYEISQSSFDRKSFSTHPGMDTRDLEPQNSRRTFKREASLTEPSLPEQDFSPNYAAHSSATKRHASRDPTDEPLDNAPESRQLSDDVVPISEPVLCEEQADLVNTILDGHNVFYTGSAGVGKSTVLKTFRRRLRERGKYVDVVAPTGRAALDVNGQTTWSYAGWIPSMMKQPLDELLKGGNRKQVRKRLRTTDVLVIDEISMVENWHFERLNECMKRARDSEAPFGGVQIVVTGDFCQLPPVKPFQYCIECGGEMKEIVQGSSYKCEKHDANTYYDKDKWAFSSDAWVECNFIHKNLTQIHRQSDPVFIDILNKLRYGFVLSPDVLHLLVNHPSDTDDAIKLFARRQQVKKVNDEEFNKLSSLARSFDCVDRFEWKEHTDLKSCREKNEDGTLRKLDDHRYDPTVHLKCGMLVVLLANLDIRAGLVNGSQGTIVGFERYDVGDQNPDNSSRDSNRNERVRFQAPQSFKGELANYCERQVVRFMEQSATKEWPTVKFLNGQTKPIYADCTVNELGDVKPYSLLSRTQIPLMAGWAMTVHKSQGMTLSRVIVDLSKSFEQGQAYVALSRAKSLEGLRVISFPDRANCGGNAEVREFLRKKCGVDC